MLKQQAKLKGSIINGVDEVNFINTFFCEKYKKKDK